MTPATQNLRSPALPPANAFLRRFTVDEYHRMIDAGILTEDDPVELLEGWVRYKMPRTPLHDSRIDVTRRTLERLLPASWWVRIQNAVTLAESEPEPDLVVVPAPAERYDDHHPGPTEIALVIEVANTSLAFDRDEKAPIYAQASIPCYWIVNLVDRQVERYTDPTGPVPVPAYRQRTDFRPGDAIPVEIAGQTVANLNVNDLFP
jgi:Putative restriction endonuclease